MAEHYPRNSISIGAWCKKCLKETPHRIDDRRKGPCLRCIERLEQLHAAALLKPKPAQQIGLFHA